jgi:hypothetical protein
LSLSFWSHSLLRPVERRDETASELPLDRHDGAVGALFFVWKLLLPNSP